MVPTSIRRDVGVPKIEFKNLHVTFNALNNYSNEIHEQNLRFMQAKS